MVYSQLVFINEESAEALMILVQDFYLLNLSKKKTLKTSDEPLLNHTSWLVTVTIYL